MTPKGVAESLKCFLVKISFPLLTSCRMYRDTLSYQSLRGLVRSRLKTLCANLNQASPRLPQGDRWYDASAHNLHSE